MIKDILIDSCINRSFQEAGPANTWGRYATPSHNRLKEFYGAGGFMYLVSYLLYDFLKRQGHHYQRKYRIIIHHRRWPGSIDEQINFDGLFLMLNTFISVQMLVVSSKSVPCCHIRANDVSPEFSGSKNSYTSIILGFGNFTINGKLTENNYPIQRTFISSCCLGFGTAVGPFWTTSSYRRDWEHLTWTAISLPIMPASLNAWIMAFRASNISSALAIYDIR